MYQDRGTPDTTHNVDLPLTTTYSCQNFCGPTARCSYSGQQCIADIDCDGCNPYPKSLKSITTSNVPGNNDAGKLTINATPTYSTLTTDIGTQSKLYNSNINNKPLQANFGVNTWIVGYNNSLAEFNKRYTPAGLQFMPKYKTRDTLTGNFMEDGPYASNSYLE